MKAKEQGKVINGQKRKEKLKKVEEKKGWSPRPLGELPSDSSACQNLQQANLGTKTNLAMEGQLGDSPTGSAMGT